MIVSGSVSLPCSKNNETRNRFLLQYLSFPVKIPYLGVFSFYLDLVLDGSNQGTPESKILNDSSVILNPSQKYIVL